MTRPSGLSVNPAYTAATPAARASGPRAAVVPEVDDTVARLARWLLLVVAADLVVTRLIVRLAIFIPKGEPWMTISAWLGRLGAVADTLVPIVGVLVLGAMLLRVGRRSMSDRVLLGAVAVIAAFGFAGAFLSPPPWAVLIVDGLVVLVAVGAALKIPRGSGVLRLATLGSVALAGAVAAAAGARMWDVVSGSLGATGGPGSALPATWVSGAGQWAFVAGAALLGIAGLAAFGWPRRGLAGAIALAAVVLLAAWRAPASIGQLTIWSIGLTGVVPAAVLATAVGLAGAGLPRLYRRIPALTTGGAIVILAGFGLAASGLLLASLVGLIFMSSTWSRADDSRRPR